MKTKAIYVTGAMVLTAGLVLAGCGGGQQAETATPKTEATEVTQAAAAYPIDWCVVSGEKLGAMGDPIVYKHAGREVKFCCQMCVGTFEADPAAYIAKLDSAAAGLIKAPNAEPAEDGGGHEGHDHGA